MFYIINLKESCLKLNQQVSNYSFPIEKAQENILNLQWKLNFWLHLKKPCSCKFAQFQSLDNYININSSFQLWFRRDFNLNHDTWIWHSNCIWKGFFHSWWYWITTDRIGNPQFNIIHIHIKIFPYSTLKSLYTPTKRYGLRIFHKLYLNDRKQIPVCSTFKLKQVLNFKSD